MDSTTTDHEMGREKNNGTYTTFSVLPVSSSPTTAHDGSRSRRAFLKNFVGVQISLRCLTLLFTAVAIYMMLSSRQSVLFFGIEFIAKYQYSAAFRFKVGTDATVSAFTLLSMILLCVLCRRPPPKATTPATYFYLLLHDVVMAVLVVAGSSGATAIGYVGRYGQDESGWIAICDRVSRFCDKVLLSIVMSFLAFFCLLLLSLMAAYKLKIQASFSE